MSQRSNAARDADVKFSPVDADAFGASILRRPGRREFAARVLSLMALLATLYLLVEFAVASYAVMTDAFVAPLILSPDSDLVLPSKLNLARLQAERIGLVGRIEQASANMHAAEQGDHKLVALREEVRQGLAWAESVTSSSLRSGSLDLSRLGQQRQLIRDRVAEQARYVRELEGQLAAGLVRKADVMRERDALSQLRVFALQNERETLQSSSQLENSQLAARALRRRAGDADAVSTPELLQHRDQLTRIEVDLLKLDAERHARASELRIAQHELEKLDALIGEVRARPIFRAIEARQNLAFVPYTQLEAIEVGGDVYECRVWGLLACRKVGTLTHIFPGELATQDPWGAVARGQYALLKLSEPEAAKAKVLRVRPAGRRGSRK